MSIATLTGNNGILTKAQTAKEMEEKAQIKEELQLAVYSIQANYFESFNRETIINNLDQESSLDLEQLVINKENGGIYKGYNFIITDNFEVIITDKNNNDNSEETKGREYIFLANNDFTAKTGGYEFYVNTNKETSTAENKSFQSTYGDYEIKENFNISLRPVAYGSTGSTIDLKTAKKIDLTGYERIGMIASVKDVAIDYLSLGVTQKDSYSYSSTLEKVTTIIDNDITYLDVSDLTGEYYIQFGIGSTINSTAEIKSIWLEKKAIETSIEIDKNEITLGQNIKINIFQKANLSTIDTSKSKYIISKDKEKYGENSEKWETAEKIGEVNKTLTYTPSDTGIYYLHVLTTDKKNNVEENVSESILVANEFFYNRNDDYLAKTGGYEFYVNANKETATAENKSFQSTYGDYEIKENFNISLRPVAYGGTGSTIDLKTTKKIDLTNCKKIGMLASVRNAIDYRSLGVTQKDSYSYSSVLEKVTTIIDNNITYLDVSALTGEYYIQFGIGSYVNGTLSVEKIWSE